MIKTMKKGKHTEQMQGWGKFYEKIIIYAELTKNYEKNQFF